MEKKKERQKNIQIKKEKGNNCSANQTYGATWCRFWEVICREGLNR